MRLLENTLFSIGQCSWFVVTEGDESFSGHLSFSNSGFERLGCLGLGVTRQSIGLLYSAQSVPKSSLGGGPVVVAGR